MKIVISINHPPFLSFKRISQEPLDGSVFKHLPSAQVMIPGSWVQVSHPAPCSTGSLLLPLPLPLHLRLACVLSLCLK